MLTPSFDPHIWAAVPFHFWSVTFFVLGSMVGSFLNVCIHRLPLGQSIVSPPSHCPHCKYSIPWYLNMPLVTWLYLRGRCRNCGAPISVRYFLVELLTAVIFLGCWLVYGHVSATLALIYAVVLAGLIAGTFIDFEHLIIPDEITIGGTVLGFACSFLVPALHGQISPAGGLRQSLIGIVVGAGSLYLIVRGGKLIFGRQKIALPPAARVLFTETALHLPDSIIPYEELFYRRSDSIRLHARTAELVDRCYRDVPILLTPDRLRIGEEELNPEDVPHLEVEAEQIVLPREAMGLGDVKFMAAIGAFLGWRAVLFSLMLSCILGAAVGIVLIVLRRREWSSRLPFGPYIAVAAAIWIFTGDGLVEWWFSAWRRLAEWSFGS
jgi:leader peptidase (prepilin peptidase) / N-methyltransferase